jgi:hypothetical protein
MTTMDKTNPATNTAEKMKTVKSAWDAAPAGPKKDEALTHYKAAQTAQTAKNDAECNRELEAAKRALV